MLPTLSRNAPSVNMHMHASVIIIMLCVIHVSLKLEIPYHMVHTYLDIYYLPNTLALRS